MREAGDGLGPRAAATEIAEQSADDGGQVVSTSRSVVGRNIVILFGTQVVTWSLAFVLAVFEPRFLGPDGLGQLRLAAAIWAIVNVFAELGTSTLLTLEFARDPERGSRLVAPVLRLRAAAELVSVVVVAVLVSVAYDADTAVTILIVGIGSIVTIFSEVARASLIGIQWMAATARADIAAKLVLVAGTIAVLLAGGGPQGVALVQVLPAAICCWLMWRALRSRVVAVPRAESVPEVTVFRRASPFLLAIVVATVYSQIDIIVISIVATVEEAGWYAAAATLYGSLLFIPNTISMALFPALAQAHGQGADPPYELLAQSVRSIALLAVPMGVGTIVVGDQVATMVLGSEFEGSGPVLALFGVVLIIMFHAVLLGRFAFAIGRHRLYITAMTVCAVLTLPLDLVLVPWTRDRFDNGAIGGVLATIITESALIVVAVWKLAPQLVTGATAVRIAKVGAAGGALFAAAWPLRDQVIVVPIVAGALAYVVVLLALRTLDENDIALLRRLWGRVRSRRSVPTA